MNALRAFVLLGIFLVVGCAAAKPEIYYWGDYEELIHDAYFKPGAADPATQIIKLNADIQKSGATGKRVAPGIYAHLGYLYAIEGNVSQSMAAFRQEQTLYPESTVFIEGMLNRAAKDKENQR